MGGGGGVHRGAHPCWPWSTGVQGRGAKNQIQKYGKISKVFQRKEIKIKLIMQCPYRRKWHF